jgi:mRNA interferase RelE/StbE
MYEVKFHPDAKKAYINADKALKKKIDRCMAYLEKSPRYHPNIKVLTGDLSGLLRYRIGNYRIVYEIDDEMVQVYVIAIAPRGDVYDM